MCNTVEILETILVIKILAKFISIIVPIILITKLFMELLKAVSASNKEMISSILQTSVKRIIAAIIIFFVPLAVDTVIDLAAFNGTMFNECMKNSTRENIDAIIVSNATKALEKAENDLDTISYADAVNKIDLINDEDLKFKYKERLNAIKKLVEAKALVDAAEGYLSQGAYEDALAFVNTLPDSAKKTELLNRLAELKEKLKKVLASVMNVNYDDAKYDGLTPLRGITLDEVLAQNGTNTTEFYARIKEKIEAAGVGTREGVVAAAVSLIDFLADYGYKISYDWGGKYYQTGVKGSWGSLINPAYCDSHSDPSYCRSTYIYSGFDCSGFVNWALINGFQDGVQRQSTSDGGTSLAGQTTAICSIGDVLITPGHIVLVVGIDIDAGHYIIAESTSGAMGTRFRNIKFGDSDYHCKNLDSLYN